MPELQQVQSAEPVAPVEEMPPAMAPPLPTPSAPTTGTNGALPARPGVDANGSGVQEPPRDAMASVMGTLEYALPVNAPLKAQMIADLQLRYGNAYVQQVVALTRSGVVDMVAPEERATIGPRAKAIPPSPADGAVPSREQAAPIIETPETSPEEPPALPAPAAEPVPPPLPGREPAGAPPISRAVALALPPAAESARAVETGVAVAKALLTSQAVAPAMPSAPAAESARAVETGAAVAKALLASPAVAPAMPQEEIASAIRAAGAMGMEGEVPAPALEAAAAPESVRQVAELAMAEAAAAPEAATPPEMEAPEAEAVEAVSAAPPAAPAAAAPEAATPPETEAPEAEAVQVVSAAAPPAAPAAGAEEPAAPPPREALAAAPAPAVTAAAPPAAPAAPEGEPVPAARKKDGEVPVAGARPGTVAAQPPGQPPALSEAAAAAPSPREAIAPAARAVRRRAAGARRHPPATTPVASAQAAAINPQTERTRTAAEQTVKHLSEAEAREVERAQFKAKLKKAIDEATPQPKTESEAEKVRKTGAKKASASLSGELARERDAAAGPLKSAAATEVAPSEQPAPPRTELQPEQVGPRPEPVSAASVVPAPLPAERLDYSSDRAPADQLMAENDVSKEQLERGNEPAFGPALEARAAAEEHEATAEARYRQSESQVQDQAQGKAQQALAQGLTGMHGERALRIGQVVGQQTGTQSKSAAERQRITDKINTIKNKTRVDVKSILDSMETEAADLFKAGLKRAEDAYEDAFEEAKGGIGTWLTTWGEDWERHIEASLATARRRYLSEVDTAIDEVADLVGTKLAEARQRVDDGRKEVEKFVAGLDQSVRQYGQEALAAVRSDFDAMEGEIDQRRDGLIDKLTQQYKESYERMSAMEEKLRAENKSLWQRVYDATVGLVKKIIEFKDMLVDVLSRAAEVIGMIILDPIGFLGNLIDGVMLGLKNFMSRLGEHLQKGLMEWLFGVLGEAGIQMPESFDLKGILSLVLQVLGLTYANIRARAVTIVGEPVVKALEQAAEIFKVLIKEGPAGLWEWIKDKIDDLKSMVLDGIKDFIMEKVIIAGITWIIGLLNPVSAFFKACKAIYDIVMFFITHASQILALVNAIIDSIAAIARGSLSVAANAVENALARAIPVVIGFLASLLGLGGISEKIRSVIEKIQAPINKAIDWVINKAVQLVKAAGKLLGLGGGKEGEKTDEPSEPTTRGLATQPAVDIPFAMSGAGHTLTFDPTLGDDVEILMASRRLPMSKEFSKAHTHLDNLRRYINSIEDPDVKDLFRAEFGTELDMLPSDLVQRFKVLYKKYFPSGAEELTDKDKQRAKQQVQALIGEVQRLTRRIGEWGDEMGVQDLTGEAIDGEVQEQGNRLWSQAWQEKKQSIENIISRYSYRGARVQMRGSVKKGFRGDPKARTRFDERDFDVDMFVVHREAYDGAIDNGAQEIRGKIFPEPAVPGLRVLSNQVRNELVSTFPNIARIVKSDVVLRKHQPRG
jgi:hypothetical protein